MPADICKAIIDGTADVTAMSVKLIGNMNMVGNAGVEPTQDEANVLMKANEDYCRIVRAIVHGWVARTPEAAEYRKKEDNLRKALDRIAPPEG